MSDLHTVLQSPDLVPADPDVLTVDAVGWDNLTALCARLGLTVVRVADHAPIPGSFWGDEEAGLIGHMIHLRSDTPVHSAMHETGHFVCMDNDRRAALHTDAGGSYSEENAVCYWQILASDHLPGIDRARMCADMDRWGYTFRLGSAAAWFAQDADDARTWLVDAGLLAHASGELLIGVRR